MAMASEWDAVLQLAAMQRCLQSCSCLQRCSLAAKRHQSVGETHEII